MDSQNLTDLVLSNISQKFGKDVTLNNILEILAISMKSAEKWRRCQLSGPEKKDAEKYYALLDADKNGSVSFSEFLAPILP